MPNLKALQKLISATVAFAAAIALTGCAMIPTNSNVRTGQAVDANPDSEFLYYSPVGPSIGDSIEAIVNGFINAGTGPQNDYAVAREYLSNDFRATWNPAERTLIQNVRPAVTIYPNNTASVAVSVVAEVDQDGIYLERSAGSTELLELELVRENGEWRISKAPNLTVVLKPVFENIFQSVSLYFFDSLFEYLVPDTRWFPSRASTPTRLTNALLKGPNPWLKEAVRSALPSGTKLSLNAVTVVAGVASVDLTNRALVANTLQRSLMKQQLRETLVQLENIYDVQILIERAPQDISTGNIRRPVAPASYPIILREGQLSYPTGAAGPKLDRLNQIIANYEVKDFAIDSGFNELVFSTPAGLYRTQLKVVPSAISLVDARANLLQPKIDQRGYVISAGRAAGSSILAIDKNGAAKSIELGQLIAFERTGFSLSADGARAVFTLNSANGLRVFLVPVVRDGDGSPVRFGTPHDITPVGLSPISASWLDESNLIVSGTNSSGQAVSVVLKVGGFSRSISPLSEPVTAAGVNSIGNFFGLAANGNLYQYRGFGWLIVASNVSTLAYPGN